MDKNCCDFHSCKRIAYPIGFKCRFCEHVFCFRHQLPEVHQCDVKNSDYLHVYKKINIRKLKSSEKQEYFDAEAAY